jgi:ribose/xylose/arabinose/galactoside ABC-type transport system permease subunit
MNMFALMGGLNNNVLTVNNLSNAGRQVSINGMFTVDMTCTRFYVVL